MGRQGARRPVQAGARERQQQTQDLAAVALGLLGRRHRRVAANAALPDGVADAWLARWLAGDGEAGEEEHVNEGVDELLGERLGLLKAILRRGPIIVVVGIGFVKEHLTR